MAAYLSNRIAKPISSATDSPSTSAARPSPPAGTTAVASASAPPIRPAHYRYPHPCPLQPNRLAARQTSASIDQTAPAVPPDEQSVPANTIRNPKADRYGNWGPLHKHHTATDRPRTPEAGHSGRVRLDRRLGAGRRRAPLDPRASVSHWAGNCFSFNFCCFVGEVHLARVFKITSATHWAW